MHTYISFYPNLSKVVESNLLL